MRMCKQETKVQTLCNTHFVSNVPQYWFWFPSVSGSIEYKEAMSALHPATEMGLWSYKHFCVVDEEKQLDACRDRCLFSDECIKNILLLIQGTCAF